jgi:uncharacterized protein
VGETRLRILKVTSRCAMPTLERLLPRAPQALRTRIAENLLEATGSEMLPCAGMYLAVLNTGIIRIGDAVILH